MTTPGGASGAVYYSWGRVVLLVSGTDLPVEQDTLPLHLIGKGSAETELAVAEFLVQRPKSCGRRRQLAGDPAQPGVWGGRSDGEDEAAEV